MTTRMSMRERHEKIETNHTRARQALTIISTMSWGLGYFGMPQVLVRFMGIRSEGELTRSRRVACVWLFISMGAALFIGIVGRQLFPSAHLTKSSAENIFITLATSSLPALLAGFVMAGILAATISSSAPGGSPLPFRTDSMILKARFSGMPQEIR